MSVPDKSRERLAFLDVARGIAALVVLFEHGLDVCFPSYHHLSQAINFSLGRIGVLLFLIVSGFIIPVSLEQGGSQARFWLRRFWRLFPLYWVSIALVFAYCSLGGRHFVSVPLDDSRGWLINLTMLEGFFNRPLVSPVFWTLQLELVIYLGCSLMFSAGFLKRAALVATLAIACYLALGLGRPFLDNKPLSPGNRSLYFLPLMGFLAQRYTAGLLSPGRLSFLVTGQFLALLGVAIANTIWFGGAANQKAISDLCCNWLTAYTIFFALVALRNRPMPAVGCWLGRISYSIYLLHPLALALVAPLPLPAWAFMSVLIAGTLLASAATYYLVEEPGIALGRKLERRWLPKPERLAQPLLRKAA